MENAIKLFNDFSSIVSDAKYKTIHRKGIPDMSTRVVCGYVVKDSKPKVSDHSNLKISSYKQMLQRLPIAIAEVKAGNTSEDLLNEIRQIIYSLYRPKEITQTAYNNIINSIKL